MRRLTKMTLEIGKTYRIKLTSGEWTDGKYLGSRKVLFGQRATSRHEFINLRTGREIVLKSLQKVKDVRQSEMAL